MAQRRLGPHPWYWEGHVQARIVDFLERSGWIVTAVADTQRKTHGPDIAAQKEASQLVVSVKGYPEAGGRTSPSSQARHWFSQAVFDLVCYRQRDTSVRLAVGLPAGFATYRTNLQKVLWLKATMPFDVYWVTESGAIAVE